MKSKILSLIIVLISAHNCRSQEIITIDLPTVLELGSANNLTIAEYKYHKELALAEMMIGNEWWMPELTAGSAIHQLWGNTMNSAGEISTGVNRQSFYGGIGVSFDLNFGEGPLNALSAKKNTAAFMHISEAAKNKALLHIIETYFDFFTAQMEYEAYEMLLQQLDTINLQIESQVDANMMYQSELLMARSNQAHIKNEMLNVKLKFNELSAKLVSLLNLDPETRLYCTEERLLPIDLIGSEKVLYEDAHADRPEMRGLQLQLESMKLKRKIEMTGYMIPSLHLETLGYAFGDVFSDIAPTSQINASLYWQIPIAELVTGGEQRRSKAMLNLHKNKIEQQKQKINEEVVSSRAQLIIAREQINVATEGSLYAKEALSQSLQRQRNGTISPKEISKAQEVYIRARLDYLKAVSEFNKAQYRYYVAVGNGL